MKILIFPDTVVEARSYAGLVEEMHRTPFSRETPREFMARILTNIKSGMVLADDDEQAALEFLIELGNSRRLIFLQEEKEKCKKYSSTGR